MKPIHEPKDRIIYSVCKEGDRLFITSGWITKSDGPIQIQYRDIIIIPNKYSHMVGCKSNFVHGSIIIFYDPVRDDLMGFDVETLPRERQTRKVCKPRCGRDYD